MSIVKLNIPCVWGGTLTGVLLRNVPISSQATTKIIGIHGWLDNLNSLLPLAQKLVDRHPSRSVVHPSRSRSRAKGDGPHLPLDYEIYLYDRAGHGFSSHLPRGSDYSNAHNLQDLRQVVQTLGWKDEKLSIIGHSYGAMLGMVYAASYPNQVSCMVSIDALLRTHVAFDDFWKTIGTRLDTNLNHLRNPAKNYQTELTMETAYELMKISRPGITDEAARLLTERSIRTSEENKLQFTRDEALKILSLFPYTADLVRSAIQSMKASVLFIGSSKPQWPRAEDTIKLLQEFNPHFEMTLIDGPHHLHMTHVRQVHDRIVEYFEKYPPSSSGAETIVDRH